MESTVTFALLRPADFVNFAGQGLLFAGRGSLVFRGAGRDEHPWQILWYERPPATR